MFEKYRKPFIKATLVKKDGIDLVKMKIANCSDQLVLVILFSVVKQVADRLGIDHRALLNKLLKLDSTIKSATKKAERAKRYPKSKK